MTMKKMSLQPTPPCSPTACASEFSSVDSHSNIDETFQYQGKTKLLQHSLNIMDRGESVINFMCTIMGRLSSMALEDDQVKQKCLAFCDAMSATTGTTSTSTTDIKKDHVKPKDFVTSAYDYAENLSDDGYLVSAYDYSEDLDENNPASSNYYSNEHVRVALTQERLQFLQGRAKCGNFDYAESIGSLSNEVVELTIVLGRMEKRKAFNAMKKLYEARDARDLLTNKGILLIREKQIVFQQLKRRCKEQKDLEKATAFQEFKVAYKVSRQNHKAKQMAIQQLKTNIGFGIKRQVFAQMKQNILKLNAPLLDMERKRNAFKSMMICSKNDNDIMITTITSSTTASATSTNISPISSSTMSKRVLKKNRSRKKRQNKSTPC